MRARAGASAWASRPRQCPKPYAQRLRRARARRGMRTGEQAKAVRKLERAGVRVAVSTLDVVDAGQAAALLAAAAEHAPVAGVFHLAMYLDDRLLASQVHTTGQHCHMALLVLRIVTWILHGPQLEQKCLAQLTSKCSSDSAWVLVVCPCLTGRGMRLQTGESWNKVVRPKALGAWNLDAATRDLASLEHFVCFSSIVATLGNAGAP